MKKFLASSWVVPVGTFLILFVSMLFVWPMVSTMTQQQLDLVGMLTGVSLGIWLAMVVKLGIGRVSIQTGLWGMNHVITTWLILIPYVSGRVVLDGVPVNMVMGVIVALIAIAGLIIAPTSPRQPIDGRPQQ